MRLAAALVLLASGCVLPQPRTIVAEPSQLEPIERLGRWDGDSFIPVTRQSVPPSHTYVLVHGWAPGWGRAVRDDPRLRSWQARDARGFPFEPWMLNMARAITATDPYAVVLAYSWIDDSATSRFVLAQRNALGHTELHGRSLAAALSEATVPEFVEGSGRVHLIGHSYGARVATIAAMSLPKAPRQLTLLDVPDAPMTAITGSRSNLGELLRHLPIGTERGQTFVDNYFSMVGQRYSNEVPGVVDVALTPPYDAFAYRQRHLYGTWFYTQSAHHEYGLHWSPLIGQPPAPGCYEQPWGELELESGCGDLR
ncbi:MAG: hypothetical protein R3B82_13870 [Sandaracinaceae bacterium]